MLPLMRRLGSAILAAFPAMNADAEDVSRDALLKAVRSSQVEIRDVEFVYEGSVRALWVPDPASIPAQNRSSDPLVPDFFQGRFAHRDEGPAHLDLYSWKGTQMGNPSRVVKSLSLDGKQLATQSFEPGGGPTGGVRTEGSWIGAFFRTEYPLCFYVAPRMIELLEDPAYHYVCRGWEKEGGRNCLAIDLINPGGKATDRFWVDLERQGHVLRYDYLEGDDLIWQSAGIELGQVTARDGLAVWFPLRARLVNYRFFKKVSKSPLSEEISGVISGTILVNQGLGDSRFRLDYQPNLADAPPAWKKATEVRASKKIDGSRTNREELERMLSEADRKSGRLQATSPSARSWMARNAGQIGLYAVGAALIVAAMMVRGRAS